MTALGARRLPRRPREARGWTDARPWLALLVTVGLALTTGVLGVTPAQAVEPNVTIALDGISPHVVTRPDDKITLKGRVTNSGSTPVYTVQALICRIPAPVTSEAQLRALLEDDPAAPTCLRKDQIGNFFNITEQAAPLAPGASGDFTVTATAADLGLTTTGVYVVGVHVRAATDRSSAYATVARARTLLPAILGNTPVRTSTVSSVVWLSSRPSLVRPGVLVDDHLAGELTGRLLTLVTAAQRSGVNWVVDPALYEEVTTMAAGYAVLDATGSPTPGTHRGAAVAWLAEFATLPRSEGFRLPFGNPDLAFGAAHPEAGVADRVAALADRVPELASLPLVLRTPDGLIDQKFLDYVQPLRASLILTDERIGPPATTSSAGTIVSTGQATIAGGPGPDARDTPLQIAQRGHADSLLGALGSSGVVRLVMGPSQAAQDELPLEIWEERVPLQDLRPSAPWNAARNSSEPHGPIGTGTLSLLQAVRADYATYGDLIADPTTAQAQTTLIFARASSAAWGSDEEASQYLAAAADAVRKAVANGLRVRVASKVVMTSRNNQFPVTVTNPLPVPVTVRVDFESSYPARLTIADSDLLTISPGESATINVNPKASVNGLVGVTAQLVTANGGKVGTAQKFTIEATEVGRVGWVIVIVSGAVLAATTVWRIRSVAAAKRKESA